MDRESLKLMTVAQLKELLADHSLPVSGRKAELIDKIDVRFPLNKEKKTKIKLSGHEIKSKEIKYSSLGKCFEVDLV